jgi:molybdopterin-guanine dinucleotide biosynthesis protein A
MCGSPLLSNSGGDGNTPLGRLGRPLGVVLAGGASRRMGRDKASLELDGESLALRAARRLAEVCATVVIAGGGRASVPGFPAVADGPGRGPAAGILGAARAWPGWSLLVLACDLPRVPAALLAELARSSADLAFPRRGGELEPACALYGPQALARLEERVGRGELAMHALALEPGLTVRLLDDEEIARFGPPDEIFLNLNTPDDLARFQGS